VLLLSRSSSIHSQPTTNQDESFLSFFLSSFFSLACLFIMIFSALTLSLSLSHQNHFTEPNRHVLTFLHPILMCKVTYWVHKSWGMLSLMHTNMQSPPPTPQKHSLSLSLSLSLSHTHIPISTQHNPHLKH
jgi:hypothetical protein